MLSLLFTAALSFGPTPSPPWHTELAPARAEAAKTGRPLLAVLH